MHSTLRFAKKAKRGKKCKPKGPKVIKKWVQIGSDRKRQVYELEDGTPCNWDGSPIEKENVNKIWGGLNTDPCFFANGKTRYREPARGEDLGRTDFIPDLKCKEAEGDKEFQYVKGKGPAPFTSHRQKAKYYRRYGFEETGFEDEARNA